MAAMDEFRDLREKVKDQPLKKKISYIWYYYKWFILGTIVIIAFIVGTIHGFMTRTDKVLFGALVNAVPVSDTESFADEFCDYAGIDTKDSDIFLNHSLTITEAMDQNTVNSSQMIMLYMSAKQLDFTVTDPDCFARLSYNDIYADLRNCLSEEQFAALEGKIYYIDRAVIAEIEEMADNDISTDNIELPNPFKPEAMKEPIPVGIDISSCKKFMDTYHYEGEIAYLGIANNIPHLEMLLTFLEYLFENEL